MWRMIAWGMAAVALAAVLAGSVRAENEGQADLDRATEVKLGAKKLSDLAEVIDLCESAMKKGLDAENTTFAKSLLASTLVQRATVAGRAIFREGPPDPLWPSFRKLAQDDLDKALGLVPDQPDALILSAKLDLLPGGDPKEAVAALDKVLASKAEMPDLRAEALVLRAGLSQDLAGRETMLDEAVKLAPGSAEAIRARGLFLADHNRPKEAAADLQKAIELEPASEATYEALALVQAELKEYDQAMVSLDKASQIRPESVTPLILRAQIHAEQKNLDAALHDLNEAYAKQPKNVLVLVMRGRLHDEMKQPEKALADAELALKLQPDFDQARRLRAALLAQAGRLDEVVRELEQVVRDSPEDLSAKIQLAMLYTAQKQPQKAVDIYSAILKEQPENAEALEGRANALLGLGKHAEAIADYNEAIQVAPDESGLLNNFAWVLATSPEDKLRDGRRAIELATRACERTGFKQAHILSTLAAAYAESGDFAKAIEWSEKAIELGKTQSPPDVQEALAKELKSYQEKKPWRELLTEGLEPGPQKKPQEAPQTPPQPETQPQEEPPAEPAPAPESPPAPEPLVL